MFLTILLAAPVASIAGTLYYVNNATGNDSNPGTQSLPWKTIQKAANTMISGDSVVVQAGTYSERVNVTRSGSSGSLITFTAQGTVQCRGFTIKGNYVKVSGFTATATQGTWTANGYGFYIQGDNCLIENNNAYYSPSGGVILLLESASCVVRNNRIHRNGNAGIDIGGTNHLIVNNEIWGTIAHHTPTGWTPGDANGIQFFGSGHIFRGNYIHDISYSDPENLGYSPHIDGFQTFANTNHVAASNVLIERNLIVLPVYKDAKANGHGFMLHDCSYITIRNNIVITHGGTNTGDSTSHHLIIENNTFVGSLAFNPSYAPVGISLEDCPYSTVRNNIVYDQVSQAIYLQGTTSTGLNIGYNCTYNSNGTNPRGTPQPHDLWGVNPKFVNAAGKDYHLQSSSPCINAGASITNNTVDYDNNSRPIGFAWDIGAYEYTGAGTSLNANANASPTSGQAPLTVNFTGSASGGTSPYSYRWTFGDGQSSTIQNPSHTYSSVGNYTATLTVTDSKSATSSKSLTISVTTTTPGLVASASASPTSGPAPLTVNFTGSATGGTPPYSYSWAFGDGASSTTQNPSHTYSSAGSYTATLNVTDNSSKSANATVSITVGSVTAANLALASETGAPAPGQGGTTDPSPGNHSYSVGSTVSLKSIPNTDYRFSKWTGDIAQASIFSSPATLTMDNDKSLSATFCTKCADVNGDLKITPGDAQAAFDIYLGKIANPTWCQLENADVKCDGTKLSPKVTPADAQWIFNKYLKKGLTDSDCSGNSRTGILSTQSAGSTNAVRTINYATFTPGQDIVIRVIIESLSDIKAFGFDLSYPSDVLTYIGLERTDLARDYVQFDANVIPRQRIYRDGTKSEPSGNPSLTSDSILASKNLMPQALDNREPSQDFGQYAGDMTGPRILRVGGYKTKSLANPSSGVLVELIFRVTGEVKDPNSILVIATYDDIQNALIRNEISNHQNDFRIKENRDPGRNAEKKSSDKRSDF